MQDKPEEGDSAHSHGLARYCGLQSQLGYIK